MVLAVAGVAVAVEPRVSALQALAVDQTALVAVHVVPVLANTQADRLYETEEWHYVFGPYTRPYRAD